MEPFLPDFALEIFDRLNDGIYQNLCAGAKKDMDHALDLLDNILKKDIKEALLLLVGNTSLEKRAGIGQRLMKIPEEAKES